MSLCNDSFLTRVEILVLDNQHHYYTSTKNVVWKILYVKNRGYRNQISTEELFKAISFSFLKT